MTRDEDAATDLVDLRTVEGLPVEFNPKRTRKRVAQADAIIDYAQKVKDWPTLERAIEEKVEEQRDFVAWWDSAVGVRHAGDTKNADRRSCLSREAAEKQTEIKQQTVSKWRKRLKDEAAESDYKAFLYGAEYRLAMGGNVTTAQRGTEGTGEVELYTPAQYIEAARTVLGAIDLDPASNDIAQQTVQASKYCTVADSGLDRDWNGRVWMNPPYHRKLLPAFIDKMVSEVRSGRTKAAIMLTNNCTDTEWFAKASAVCSAICFTRGRIKFLQPDGEAVLPTQGQAFFYFGDDVASFYREFVSIGDVYVRYTL